MRKPRFKAPPEAPVAYYHCTSRVVDGTFILQDKEKAVLRDLFHKYSIFCGVELTTFSLMSNHFHALVEVPKRPEEGLSQEELLRRLSAIKSPAEVAAIQKTMAGLADDPQALAEFKEQHLRRMWDISPFMKSVKQCFTQWYNGEHDRKGTLWEGRFNSVLVEGTGETLSVMAAYIDLNPVRAGLVDDPKDYRWSGYGEAVAGDPRAKEALKVVAPEGEDHMAAYRMLLYGQGEQEGIGTEQQPVRRGISQEEVKAVWEAGGKLSLSQLVRCRVRYFVYGAVIGSKEFVNEMYRRRRELFGPKRKDGARPLRGVAAKGLYSMRALRVRPIG